MNKQSNTKKNSRKKYNLSSKGFTLVELLAVIALLAIISVIAVYSAVNVIGNAKQKSYDVSISNIEKQAGVYAIENQNDFIWLNVDNDSTKQYFCVSVQDLIDTGYFKNDVLDSYIKEGVTVNGTDNIYLERDKATKTLEKNILLSAVDGYDGLCGNISANGNINFLIQPIGWAKEKEVIITYKLLNNSNSVGNYKYSYIFEKKGTDNEDGNSSISKENNFDKNTVVEKVTITENGVLNATIDVNDGVSETLEITTIDNNDPEIVVNVENGSTYSKSKEAVIKLVDNESGFRAGNYNIYYKWSMSDMSCEQLKSSGEKATLVVEDNNSNTSSSVGVIIDKETGAGKLYVCGDNITDYVGNEMGDTVTTKDVLLDNKEPVVSLGTYNGDSEVNRNVTIPIVLTDDHSGVDGSRFDLLDVKVSVGGTELTSGVVLNKVSDNNYNLVITNSINNGKVKIIVKQNGIYDKAGNGNQEKMFEPDIEFKNIYKISYNNNGGTGSMTDTECIYGENCTLRANSFTRAGYTFLGWSTDSSSTIETYRNGYTYKPFNQINNITLYAVWRANKVYINYKVNGGVVTENTSGGKYTTDSSGLIYRDGKVYTQSISYNSNMSSDGLANYNNKSYMNITRKGYAAPKNEEWKCLSGNCKQTTYSHATVYNASNFCDASNGDCTITLGVNWTPNTYTVTYNSGDLFYGKGNVSETAASGNNGNFIYSISNGVITATGNVTDSYGYIPYRVYLEANKTYIFNCDTSGTWNGQVEVYLMLNGSHSHYYRMGSKNNYVFTPSQSGEYWVRLDVNVPGEKHTFSNMSISYVVDTKSIVYGNEYGTMPSVSRSGYNLSGWYTEINGGTKVTSSTTVNKTENHVLYAHWTTNIYTVVAHPNSGTISPTSGWTAVGGLGTYKKTISYNSIYGTLPTPTKTGYTFDGWYDVSQSKTINLSDPDGLKYVHTSIIDNVYPGVTYTITMDLAVLNSGTATKFHSFVYDSTDTKTVSNEVLMNFSNNTVTYTLTVPETVDPTHNLKILIYAGVWGSTSGNSVTYKNIRVSTIGTSNATKYQSANIATYTGNHILFAHWTPDTYTVSYDANGGSGAPSSQTKTHGVVLTLDSTKPTRDNYTFLGWSTDSSATSATYQPNGEYTLNENKTLYAVWKSNTKCYKINTPSGVNCRAGTSISSSKVAAIPNGWYVKVDDVVTANSYTWYHSVKFGCYFVSNYAVEYVPEDGVCPETTGSSSGGSPSGGSSSNTCGNLWRYESKGIIYCCTKPTTNVETGDAYCYMLT